MSDFFSQHVVPIAKDIIFALIVFVIGMIVIRILNKRLPNMRFFAKLDKSACTFIVSTIKILLYVFLVVIIISILGVPMTSIIAAITSAFLAVGLALQGALSNFAGGIMLLIFRPFKVGDFITCTGGTGTVKEISFIYTSLVTDDNNRITVPNGTLMNDSVVNHTVEGNRRADIKFAVAYGTDEEILREKLLALTTGDERVIQSRGAEFKTIGYLENGVQYAFRIWCDASDYWAVYFDYMEKTKNVLEELGVSAPTAKVKIDN